MCCLISFSYCSTDSISPLFSSCSASLSVFRWKKRAKFNFCQVNIIHIISGHIFSPKFQPVVQPSAKSVSTWTKQGVRSTFLELCDWFLDISVSPDGRKSLFIEILKSCCITISPSWQTYSTLCQKSCWSRKEVSKSTTYWGTRLLITRGGKGYKRRGKRNMC